MATFTVTSDSEWAAALAAAVSGDTILLEKEALTVAGGRSLAAGVTVDLQGHELTFSGADGTKGLTLAGGATIRNGTLRGTVGGVHYVLWNWYGGEGFHFHDLFFRDCVIAIKLSGAGGSYTSTGLDIQRVDIVATNEHDLTVVDLGPGIVHNSDVTDLRIVRPSGGDNTAADGIAWEHATGYVRITRLYVEGAAGDGVDIKNLCDASLLDVEVNGAGRNGIKLWGKGRYPDGSGTATRSTMTRCKVRGTQASQAIAIASGDVRIEDCYFRGEVGAASLGNGFAQTDPEQYGYGSCDVVAVNSVFTRNADKVSSLMSMGGGDSTPITQDPTSDFTRCAIWNPNHETLMEGNTAFGGSYPGQTKAQALLGNWRSNFHDCTCADEAVERVAINPPLAPGSTPPPANTTPTCTLAATGTGFAGLEYIAEFAVADADGDRVTVTATAAKGAEAAACIVGEPGYGTLWGVSFTPSSAGVWTLTVTLDDGTDQVERVQTVTIAAEVPRVTLVPTDVTWGIGTHPAPSTYFRDDYEEARRVANWMRIDVPWGMVETSPGRLDFAGAGYFAGVIATWRALGGKCVLVLGGQNAAWGMLANHLPRAGSAVDEQLRAFVRYAVAAVGYYGTDGVVYDLINEPTWDLDDANRNGNVEWYARLVRCTVSAIKAAYPNACVVGGSVGEGHWGATDPLGPGASVDDAIALQDAAGGAACLDYVSVHAYCHTRPEKVGEWWADGFAPPRPLVQLEAGWAQDKWGWDGNAALPVSETDHAMLVLRQRLEFIRLGWPLDIQFNWQDTYIPGFGTWGLLRYADDSHKPAYDALAFLVATLAGFRYQGLQEAPTGCRVMRFSDGAGSVVDVAWSVEPGHEPEYVAPADCRIFGMLGVERENAALTLGPEPVYILHPRRIALALRADPARLASVAGATGVVMASEEAAAEMVAGARRLAMVAPRRN